MIKSEMINWGLFANIKSVKVRFFLSLLTNVSIFKFVRLFKQQEKKLCLKN